MGQVKFPYVLLVVIKLVVCEVVSLFVRRGNRTKRITSIFNWHVTTTTAYGYSKRKLKLRS